MWKGCAFANAARNGVFAALLAAEGMTGPAPIFEGDLGFMKLVTASRSTSAPMGGERQRRRLHDHQDLHQVLAGRVSLAERHRRRPAAPHGRSATSRKVAVDRHPHVRRAPYNIIGKYPEKLGAEDARDGRPQPALLHRRRPARRRRHLDASSTRALHRLRTCSTWSPRSRCIATTR